MRPLALACLFTVASCGGTTPTGGGVPFQSGSPWPKFRADAAQTGATARKPITSGGHAWTFPTGKGVFSSPVVGADGTVYVGSANRYFYALNPDGTLKWKILTGEIIDSAALLDDKGRVYFGSGDGKLRALDAATGASVWSMSADAPGVTGGLIDWFEGNVAMAPTGKLYVPNDNFSIYQVDRDSGAPGWHLEMPDQTWSLPAVDEKSGRVFLGNNNLVSFLGNNLYAVDPDGTVVWSAFTAGTVAASPLLTDDAMIVGAFDGYVRAYDRESGAEKWSFGARDHIYASPARLPDGTIVQASADGSVYALDAASGALRWSFDRLAPIRSSPAVDGDGNVYFGAGDGRMYVLGPDGQLRWSILLIAGDRRDLNSSPALGSDAVYIGGESGEVFSVPYDFCLRPEGMASNRCVAGDPPLPSSGALLLSVGTFGATSTQPSATPATIDPNQPLVFSFLLRDAGKSALSVLDPGALAVITDPPNDLVAEVAGDGKFFTVTPRARWVGDANHQLEIQITAPYLVGLARDGLKLSGGSAGGMATLAFTTTVAADAASPYPLVIPQGAGDAAGVWEVSRLALPLPTLLPSYNQIGFDSLHYLVGLVEGDGAHGIAWMAGAKLAADSNTTVIDPATRALFPLVVDYQGGFLTLSNQDGVRVEVMNATIPFRTFRMAVPLAASGDSSAALRLGGSTLCGQIAVYGAFLQKLGLCNPQTDVLSVVGGALFHPWSGGTQKRPAGVGTVMFARTADAITATLAASALKAGEHVYSVLAIDGLTGRPVALDYGLDTQVKAAMDGTVQSVSVAIGGRAAGTNLRLYLMVDTYPAASGTITM